MEAAVSPLFGLRWTRSVVSAIDSRWLNRLLAFARNSPLPYRTYKSTASLLSDALADDFTSPPVWGDWRILSARFRLDTRYTLKKLIPVVHWCALQGWFQPFELSVLSFTEIQMRAEILPGPLISNDLWKADVLAYAPTNDSAELSLRGASHEAEAITARVRAASLESSTATSDLSAAIRPDMRASDFLWMGPCDRLKAFRAANTPRDSPRSFCQAGQRLNALKSIKGSLPSFPSSLRCYFSFCELSALPAFPVL